MDSANYATLSKRTRASSIRDKGFLARFYDHRTALDEVVMRWAAWPYMTGRLWRPVARRQQRERHQRAVCLARWCAWMMQRAPRRGPGEKAVREQHPRGAAMLQFAVGKAAPMPGAHFAPSIYDVFKVNDEQIFLAWSVTAAEDLLLRPLLMPIWLRMSALPVTTAAWLAREWLILLLREAPGGRTARPSSQNVRAAWPAVCPHHRPAGNSV